MSGSRGASVLLALTLAIAIGSAPAGCAGRRGSGPYEPQRESARNPVEAQRLTMEAADLIAEDPARAEALLREALGHDLYCGPAHNNLGVIYLERGELYEAAHEFEWARKLMPGAPDPRVNLALTLERAGRTDRAIDAYESALEVAPESVPAAQGLARLQVRSGRTGPRTRELLELIALRGESEPWRRWARGQLATSGEP